MSAPALERAGLDRRVRERHAVLDPFDARAVGAFHLSAVALVAKVD